MPKTTRKHPGVEQGIAKNSTKDSRVISTTRLLEEPVPHGLGMASLRIASEMQLCLNYRRHGAVFVLKILKTTALIVSFGR